jgi:hypothetical protein
VLIGMFCAWQVGIVAITRDCALKYAILHAIWAITDFTRNMTCGLQDDFRFET